MPTYTPIQSIQVSSATDSVVFSNIPQAYQDLIVVSNIKCNTSNTNIRVRLNGDTASNYSVTYFAGNGSTTESGRASNQTSIDSSYQGADVFGNIIYSFNNYSNTTNNKTLLSRSNNASNFSGAYIGLWRSTAAITSINIFSSSSNIAVGSTFDLYGVGVASYASGGQVFYSSNYAYHVFKDTGNFIPSRNLSCEFLIVAGGGGGGSNMGGGGGAGGLVYGSSSFTSGVSYTASIGGGGSSSSDNSTRGGSGVNSTFASLTATGGGGGGSIFNKNGATGGSGGGGAGGYQNGTAGTGGSNTASQGSIGGSGASGTVENHLAAGGGGGSASAGINGTGAYGSSIGGNGGDGLSTYSAWANVTGTGVNGAYAGGGGGGVSSSSGSVRGSGGLGGGGNGGGSSRGSVGTINTGGGGGGGGNGVPVENIVSYAGGSGLVIVRYPI